MECQVEDRDIGSDIRFSNMMIEQLQPARESQTSDVYKCDHELLEKNQNIS